MRTAEQRLAAIIKRFQEEDKQLDYFEALQKAQREYPELAKRYVEEGARTWQTKWR
jgi:NADH:ubiquinone oxidoreductase subunit E